MSNIPGKAGLSAFIEFAKANRPGNYVQKIDVARLTAPLAAILEDDGHVGIAPVTADVSTRPSPAVQKGRGVQILGVGFGPALAGRGLSLHRRHGRGLAIEKP